MNKVTAGRFTGRRVGLQGALPCICLGWRRRLVLDRLIVQQVQLLCSHSDKSPLSGWLLGSFGRFLGQTMWLSAIQSARSRSSFLCKVSYRDGSCSILLLDEVLFSALSTAADILS